MRFDFEKLEFADITKDGDKLAFACSDTDISWKQLFQLTQKVCVLITSHNSGKAPVIIYGSKEHLFPVSMLSCIKSETPYVAVDRIIPKERIEFIIKATGAQVLINCTDEAVEFEIPKIINSDYEVIQNKITATLNHSIEKKLCYILFTSGSTGSPKGVQISLEAVRSFISWMNKIFPVNADCIFINQATFSFDISLVEFLGTLSLGASAILNSPGITKANPQEFIARIKKYNGNFWNSTPSFIYQYLMHPDFTSENLPALETFLFMGEELPSKIVERIFNNFKTSRVYNAYGPTEATVVTTFIEITPEILAAHSKSLPIGFPKADGKVLILNESNDREKSGEIIIAGDHVSHGYLNNPALSAEKFFTHEGKRAYKTGDLGYYKDEMIFFEGRIDDQVKYNGYRIELDEINSSLHRIAGISEAVAIPLKAGNTVKKIIAFIKVEKEMQTDLSGFKLKTKEALLRSIPEYMVPADLCVIDEFPVNNNHKIDRKELINIYAKNLWK
jgi:D-alanine--poly(phosphoribitol) ligase subunit 1